jgi:hypothetical protein
MSSGAFVAALLLAFGAQACVLVAPFEREHLAHPSMTTADLARAREEHVRAVQEGAIGGGTSVGGGCGCN